MPLKVELYSGHLCDCAECRDLVELLRLYGTMAGRLPLIDAPESLIKKAVAIAQTESRLRTVVESIAELLFDSWLSPAQVGVRGPDDLGHRRIRFKTVDGVFDMRAERRKSGWSFVARLGSSGQPPLLMAGRKKVTPDATGFYQWHSACPPKKLSLCSEKSQVVLPELVWKRKKKS